MSDEDDKKPKNKKSKAKDKKGTDKGKKGAAEGGISLASHPQASVAIRSLKGWGGVIGFVLAALLSVKAGVPLSVLGLRSLVAGVLGYMVAWCCGVAVWRAIVTAEARAAIEHRAQAAAQAAAKAGKASG